MARNFYQERKSRVQNSLGIFSSLAGARKIKIQFMSFEETSVAMVFCVFQEDLLGRGGCEDAKLILCKQLFLGLSSSRGPDH